MNNRDKFLMFVSLGALARDISQQRRDSEQIISVASRIPEKRIPPNAFNAAKVFINYASGRGYLHKWMRPELN